MKLKIASISDGVCNGGSSMRRMRNSSPFSSLFSVDFYAFILILIFRLSFGLLILQLSWVVAIEPILVLIQKCFNFVGFILLNVRRWFVNRKLNQFLARFRHLVMNWKVKLDVGKLGFDLSEWDLQKGSPFKKPLNLIIVFLMIIY